MFCVCVFLFSLFIFATFNFILLINNMLYLKNLKFNSTRNWNAFWKIIVQDKCQVSKNFKQSFLRYIENTNGSVGNFAKCTAKPVLSDHPFRWHGHRY